MPDILQIKNKCKHHIHLYYSTEKQTCVNELQGYTQEQKNTMWVFINACRARSDEYEAAVDSVIDYSDIAP